MFSLYHKFVDPWTALINGYTEHGQGGTAIQCFEELLEQGNTLTKLPKRFWTIYPAFQGRRSGMG